MEFLNTHRFPIHRRILQFWQLYKHSDTITSCFCGLKPCVCDIVTSKSLRHSFKDSHRPSTQIQHPHISPPMIVSLSVAISINTMTPILETPSCASTNIQPDTNNFKEHHCERHDEGHQQPDPAYMAEFLCVPCPCEPQPFNAFRISFAFLRPCTECSRRNPKLKLLPQFVMHPHRNSDSLPRIVLPSLPHTHGHSTAIYLLSRLCSHEQATYGGRSMTFRHVLMMVPRSPLHQTSAISSPELHSLLLSHIYG